MVAKQQLKCMGPSREFDRGLGLSAAKVEVIVVAQDWFVHRRKGYIDQQVMMPGILFLDAGRRDAHSGKEKRTVSGLIAVSPSYRLTM